MHGLGTCNLLTSIVLMAISSKVSIVCIKRVNEYPFVPIDCLVMLIELA